EERNRTSNSAISELIETFEDNNNIFFLQFIMHFITFNMQQLVNDIEFFKIHDKPLASFLATRLILVRARLFSGVEIPPKSNEMIKLCEDFNLNSTIHNSFFKEAFQLALDKFDKHI
ncbi:4886_t:CDS:2, partial [Cetraspora pellucida]